MTQWILLSLAGGMAGGAGHVLLKHFSSSFALQIAYLVIELIVLALSSYQAYRTGGIGWSLGVALALLAGQAAGYLLALLPFVARR